MRLFILLSILHCSSPILAHKIESHLPKQEKQDQQSNISWINKKFLNLTYAFLSPSQKLDLYLPNEAQEPYPLIIHIHGGGFAQGKKSQNIDAILKSLNRGYAVASVDYRLSGEATFPAAVHDIKGAIKYLRAHSFLYKLDPDKFVTWGESAGGHLSAMAALSAGVLDLIDPRLGYPRVSERVQAAVIWYAPINFATIDLQLAALGVTKPNPTSSKDSYESRYLGKPVGSDAAEPLVIAANPATYITKDDPPVLIQHGQEDKLIPLTQSENLAASISQANGFHKVSLDIMDSAAHGGHLFENDENINRILDFLDTKLRR